LDNPNTDA